MQGKLDNLELAFFIMLVSRLLRSRRSVFIVFLAVFCAAIWFCHPWLLQCLAKLAIADNPRPDAEYLVLYADEASASYRRVYDAAAAAYRANPRRTILLIEPRPHILEQYGILPGFSALSRRELGSRGVADSAIRTLDGTASDTWRAARLLGQWLQDHPEGKVEFYVDRFQSRNLCCVAGQVLQPALAKRIFIHPLPDSKYDETDWWKSRDGVKAFMFAHLALIYARFHGEPEEHLPGWNPDDYARTLEPNRGFERL
jgi:hypothetical protein